MFLPKNNIPRWAIFFIDIFLSIIALFLAYIIRFDFINFNKQIFENELDVFINALPFYLGIRILLAVIFKTYAGIIRYTSTQDTKRIFITISIGSIILGIISSIKYFHFDNINLLPISIIVIEYLMALFLLLAFRMLVKLLYVENLRNKGTGKNILIYGAGEMGIIAKNTLEKDINKQFKVIGFIDDDKRKKGKMIDRCSIYTLNNLKDIAKKNKISQVIIAIKSNSNTNKRKLINECLKLDIGVASVPSIDLWIDGGFSTKQIKNINIEDLLGRDEIKLSNENISKEIHNKTILVSGAAGSIGSELCRQILKFSPKKLILLDQAESMLYNLDIELKTKYKNISWEVVIADVSDKERIKKVFTFYKPNYVFHAAAYKHVPLMEDNPSEAIKTNVLGTKIMSDLSDEFSVSKMVFISTDKAVNPTNVMGASKRIAEIYCQSLNKTSRTSYITTRFGNVLGSNGSVIPLFKKQIENAGPITVTDENVTRFFMTIPEACQLVLEAGYMGNGGEIFVFDMGESIKIIDLAKQMIKLSGLELGKDIDIKITGLRPGEKLFEELLSNSENTMPTHHNKILIGKVKEYDFKQIESEIDKLINTGTVIDNDAIVSIMKQIVPEFISNNSNFSELDYKM